MRPDAKLWILAYRNMGRNMRRTLSTAVAVGAGFVGLVLLSAYIYRSQKGLEISTVYVNQKGHLALFKEGSVDNFGVKPARYLISQSEQDQIQKILLTHQEKLEFTGKYLSGTGLLSNGSTSVPYQGLGIEPEVYAKVFHHPNIKRWIPDWVDSETIATADRLKENPELISITRTLGELIGRKPPFSDYPDETRWVQLATKDYFNDFNATNAELGLRHTTGISFAEDTSLYGSLKTFQDLYATDGIQYWALFLKPGTSTFKLQAQLESELKQAKLPVEVRPYYDETWGAYYKGSMSFLYVMTAFFVSLICGAVLLSIVNSTTLGIIERTKEIGTLRAVGFRPSHVQGLFWRENFILSVISILAGLIIAEGLAQLVNGAHILFEPPGTQGKIQFLLVTHWALSLTMAFFVLFLNVATTIFVVRSTSRTQVIHLLTSAGG
jgi:putative ABC transport system permease protein